MKWVFYMRINTYIKKWGGFSTSIMNLVRVKVCRVIDAYGRKSFESHLVQFAGDQGSKWSYFSIQLINRGMSLVTKLHDNHHIRNDKHKTINRDLFLHATLKTKFLNNSIQCNAHGKVDMNQNMLQALKH